MVDNVRWMINCQNQLRRWACGLLKMQTPGLFDLIQVTSSVHVSHRWASFLHQKVPMYPYVLFKSGVPLPICTGDRNNSNPSQPLHPDVKSFYNWVSHSRKDSQWQRLLEEYAKEISVTCELRRALAEAG